MFCKHLGKRLRSAVVRVGLYVLTEHDRSTIRWNVGQFISLNEKKTFEEEINELFLGK